MRNARKPFSCGGRRPNLSRIATRALFPGGKGDGCLCAPCRPYRLSVTRTGSPTNAARRNSIAFALAVRVSVPAVSALVIVTYGVGTP